MNLIKATFYTLGESIFGLIIGLYFLFMLNNSMGQLIIIISFLITFSRYLICKIFINELETIIKFYQAKDEIRQKKDIEFLHKAEEIQETFFKDMHDLAQGTITYNSIVPYLEAAKNHVKKTKINMKTTALVSPDQWEKNGQLYEYFQEQVKALEKNKKLKISRIFFLKAGKKNDAITKRVLKMHKNAGIEVYIAKENLPKKITAKIKPFVLYDDETAIIGNLSDGQIPTGIKTINKSKIRECQEIFEEVRTSYSYLYE